MQNPKEYNIQTICDSKRYIQKVIDTDRLMYYDVYCIIYNTYINGYVNGHAVRSHIFPRYSR